MSSSNLPVSHAQWGDDLLVWEHFNRSPIGIFLEAGANDPIKLSQTYLLEQQGWTGILIDPVPSCCEALRRVRTRSHVFQNALGGPQHRGKLRLRVPSGCSELTHAVANGGEVGDAEMQAASSIAERRQEASDGDEIIEAGFITIDEALKTAGFDRLDYLSLDLEGFELPALQGLDFSRIRPRVVIIEDRLENLSRHRFMLNKGYKLVRRNGSNNWYVPSNEPFSVSLQTRLKLFRKCYLSIPFRYLRDNLRKLRKSPRVS
ncbi:MAG TPA: FkbM family methyltransferase [Rariglobus sp.]|nr:FkbM family methyltransferase [Rariglobus sp.]